VLDPSTDDLLSAYGKLQDHSRRRTIALAGAAHELKTPLAIIGGYVELLLSEKLGPLTVRQRQVLDDTQLSCARLQHFVQDFLTYSAIETGKLTLRIEPGDLKGCLGEVYGMWGERFASKGVALYFPTTSEIPPVWFDYHKVQHVLSNLLENSLKFTPAAGSVWLTADAHIWERRSRQDQPVVVERRKAATATTNAVRVTVSDTGPGIPPEYQQEIFDDFFKPPHDQTGGTGLGLAIARRLVQAHGGKIWVESSVGTGSKFCFFLPLKPE
jgi:two-component system sensor histidine kinase/response regulator